MTNSYVVLSDLLMVDRSEYRFRGEGTYLWSGFSPEQIARIEPLIANDLESRQKAQLTIKRILETLRAIHDYVAEWGKILQSDGESQSLIKYEASSREHIQTQIYNLLSTVSGTQYQGVFGLFFTQDDLLAADESGTEEYKQARSVSGLENEYEPLYDSLLRLISNIVMRLEREDGVSYRVETGLEVQRRPYDEFTVIQTISPDIDTLILSGERYGREGRFRYYSVRWPTTRPSQSFIDALYKIMRSSTKRRRAEQSEPKPTLVNNPEHEYWKQGLVMVTSDGCVGYSLEDTLENWKHLRQRISDTEPEKLSQIWLNTQIGRFVVDRIPQRGEEFRYVTVMSHLNLANEIALLFYHTGVIDVFPSKLSKALHRTLEPFPSDAKST